ncbi:MAG: S8 family serine peptidase [Desulfuromonadales bacterium]|nr:S8 family serine peptidase [Desulfuromonadales bacterium]NIS40259.1 S8 family serine peptidase [Desulfuromonadales bacterium]
MKKFGCVGIPRGQLLVLLLLAFVLLALTPRSTPVFAASGDFGDVPTAASPSAPTAAAQRGPNLADRDGNGLSDGLQTRLAELLPAEPVEVVVTMAGAGSAESARQAVGPFEVRRVFRVIEGFAATMTAAQARALAGSAGVFRVEEDFRVSTMLDAANDDFGTAAARSAFSVDGTGTGVCVVDTGVDPLHEQLDGTKVVDFVDYVNGQTTAYDDHGHGTHVAAIAAGDGDPTFAFMGVAPGASVYAAKVLDSAGSGTESDVIAGVEWCADPARSSIGPGVDIISMSLGSAGSSDGQDALSQAVNNAVASGKTAVVAAGNSGAGPQTVGSPGAAEDAITVGAAAEWSADAAAVNHSDGVFPAWFSSRGPTADGRTKPDIASPGVSITSAKAGTSSDYATWSGTSMATPFVSGTVALALQYNALSPVEVKNLLMATAQDRGSDGLDNDWGAGLLDGYAFVSQARNAEGNSTAFPTYQRVMGSVADNGEWSWSFDIPEDALGFPVGLAITIDGQPECSAWLMPGVCWIYEWSPDLDAELVAPDGTTVLTESTCLNDAECGGVGRQETLHVMPVAAGTYTVRVYPFGDDPNNGKGGSFALDVSTGPESGSSEGDSEADTTAPTVTAFDLPESYNSLTVPILEFAATDDVGVTGYMVSESSATPDAGDPAWSTTPAAEYTFDAEGTWTLYAWAKDEAGNISESLSDSVSVTLETSSPDASPSVSIHNPVDGSTVSETVTIQVDASDTEDADDALNVEVSIDSGSWQVASYNSTSGYYETGWDTSGLTDGSSHSIDARATDSGDNTTMATQVSVTVDNGGVGGGSSNAMGVFAIDWQAKRHLDLTVNIRADLDGSADLTQADEPVSSADVTFVLTHDTNNNGVYDCESGDKCWTFIGATDKSGSIQEKLLHAPSGNYQAEVIELTHSSYSWDKGLDKENGETFTK